MEGAKLKAEALKIQSGSELAQLRAAREAEVKFLEQQAKIEIERARELNRIETEKVRDCCHCLSLLASFTTGLPVSSEILLQEFHKWLHMTRGD